MAFPGGRHESDDPSLLATAIRETQEEVGLDLRAAADHIGQLDDLQAIARGKPQETVIRPFVFEVHRDAPILADEREVAGFDPVRVGAAIGTPQQDAVVRRRAADYLADVCEAALELDVLGGDPAASVARFGEILGITRERVRQIKEKALAKLRRDSGTAALRGFMAE